MSMSPPLARVVATGATVAVLTLLGSTAAEAHVRVIPESTVGGSFTKLTFRVPSESDTANTTSLAITLPTDTPLAFVSAQKLPGWKVEIVKAKLDPPVEMEGVAITEAASTVTWTAEKGGELGPGEFQEFSISGGPLPVDAKNLAFPAAQTYSDGTVAHWDQPQAEGAEEPEHPVPSFEITAALPEGADADAAPAAQTSTPTSASATGNETDGLARGAGFGGLALGLLGLAVGLLAWRKAGTAGRTGGQA